MINLTEKAINKIKEISEEEGLGHHSIRIKVLGSGCAGFKHDISFDEIFDELDEVFDHNVVKIIVDPLSLQYLDGALIDYTESVFGGGFTIKSPNVKGTCGCGSSYNY